MGSLIFVGALMLATVVCMIALAVAMRGRRETVQDRIDRNYAHVQQLVHAWQHGEVELQPVWTDRYLTTREADAARSWWLPLYTSTEGRWILWYGRQVKEVTYTRRPWWEIAPYRQTAEPPVLHRA